MVWCKTRAIRLERAGEKFDIPKTGWHTALGDAYFTGIAFVKILGDLKGNGNFSVIGLLK